MPSSFTNISFVIQLDEIRKDHRRAAIYYLILSITRGCGIIRLGGLKTASDLLFQGLLSNLLECNDSLKIFFEADKTNRNI